MLNDQLRTSLRNNLLTKWHKYFDMKPFEVRPLPQLQYFNDFKCLTGFNDCLKVTREIIPKTVKHRFEIIYFHLFIICDRFKNVD